IHPMQYTEGFLMINAEKGREKNVTKQERNDISYGARNSGSVHRFEEGIFFPVTVTGENRKQDHFYQKIQRKYDPEQHQEFDQYLHFPMVRDISFDKSVYAKDQICQ